MLNNMLNNMKIGTKLTIGFAVLLLLLALVGAVGIRGVNSSEEGIQQLSRQLEITQHLRIVIDDIFLAQVAATEMIATGDVSLYDKIPAYIEDSLRAAMAAEEKCTSQTSRDFLKKIRTLTQEYADCVAECRRLLIESEKLVQYANTRGSQVDALCEELIEYLLNAYEQREREGQTLTLQQLQSYGGVLRLLELSAQMRIADRDYLIAADDPKKTAEQMAAKKMFNDNAALFGREAARINEMFTVETAKVKLANAVQLVREWTEASNKAMELLDQSGASDAKSMEIANTIQGEAEQLTENMETVIRGIKYSVSQTMSFILWFIVLVALFAVAMGIVCAIVLTTNIASGITFAVQTMNKVVGEGDLNVAMDPVYLLRKDEIGLLAQELQAVLNDYHAVDEMANALANGNWKGHMKEKGPLDTMNINLDRMIDQVNKVLNEINETVKQVAT